MIDDFGPDFDADGNPLEEGESDRISSEEERDASGQHRGGRGHRGRGGRRLAILANAASDDRREGAMATQKEVKNRINSVKNIRKITRAMEMVAAARLRRAEQRIDAMRPYAQAIRKVTQQVADAAGPSANRVSLLQRREDVKQVGDHARHRRPRPRRLLQHPDHPRRAQPEERARAPRARKSPSSSSAAAATRRSASAARTIVESFIGFTDRPAVRRRPRDRPDAHRRLHRRGARPRRADLQPLRLAADPVRPPPHAAAAAGGRGLRRGRARTRAASSTTSSPRRTTAPTGSTSRSPRRRSRISSPSTSTSRSSGRCSSRPPPSTGRG